MFSANLWGVFAAPNATTAVCKKSMVNPLMFLLFSWTSSHRGHLPSVPGSGRHPICLRFSDVAVSATSLWEAWHKASSAPRPESAKQSGREKLGYLPGICQESTRNLPELGFGLQLYYHWRYSCGSDLSPDFVVLQVGNSPKHGTAATRRLRIILEHLLSVDRTTSPSRIELWVS